MAEFVCNRMKDIVMDSHLGTRMGMVKEVSYSFGDFDFLSGRCNMPAWCHLLYLLFLLIVKKENSGTAVIRNQRKEIVGGSTDSVISSCHEKNKDGKGNNGIAIEPEAGTILMHLRGDWRFEHEADPIIDKVKYALRTDVVYILVL